MVVRDKIIKIPNQLSIRTGEGDKTLNMRVMKYINLIFVFTTMVVVGACVPKATDKKATCGKNEAFNSVTRSCYSITEVRYKPVATTSSESLTQETSKTITLAYTDRNNDLATACKVSLGSPSSNIEVMSPLIINGGLFTEGEKVLEAASDLANAIPGSDPVKKLAATNAQMYADEAFTKAKTSYSYDEIFDQLDIFITQVNTLVALAPYFPTVASVQYFYNLTQTRLLTYNPLVTVAANRCECAAGVCTATIIPKINQTGTGGFTYTITDDDGVSSAKSVTTTITAIPATTSHLKPVAESTYASFAESSTSIAPAAGYAFTLPVGGDLDGSTNFTYAFSASGVTSKGKVYGCAGLKNIDGTNTASTDTSCVYKPSSGDGEDGGVVAVASTPTPILPIGDLYFEAIAPGTYGDNLTIQFFSLQDTLTSIDPYLTKAQIFGMISTTYNESFVRVVGNAIKVFINPGFTTSENIRDLINSHRQASKMVVASGGSLATPAPATVTPSAMAFTGGIDAYDKIAFTVSKSGVTSTNTANVLIKIDPSDDAPVTPTEYNVAYYPLTLSSATTVAMAETDSAGQTITLPYYDPDNAPVIKPVTCAIDFATLPNMGLSYKVPTTCSCDGAGVCSATVVPNALFNGTGKFSYTITTTDQYSVATRTSASQAVNVSVWEVNDTPTLTISSATSVVSGTPTTTVAPLPNPYHTKENSSSAASSNYLCFTVAAGGGSDEATQSLTITPSQVTPTSDPNLTLAFEASRAPGATGNSCGAGQYMLPFTSSLNISGDTNVKITLTDNGTTHGVSDPLSSDTTIPLTVDFVNDPPAFIDPVFAAVDTNEGGVVQTDGIFIDEDLGGSTDENIQGVSITSITSDNPTVLPSTSITYFYDLNDNGVEDTNENPLTAAPLRSTLELAAATDVKSHKVYFKLSPVNGVAGNANITVTLQDDGAGTPTATKTFSLVVHPIAALHGGWENISAIGVKSDKNGLPVAEADIQCDYNKASDTNKCGTAACTGSNSPHGDIIPDAANVIFYDSANKKCYRSKSNSKFSWVDMTTTCPVTRIFVSPTALSSALTAAATTITVTSTTGFPTAGTVTIGSEQITYTNKTATTFTGATRGANSTTAATHNSADVVSYTANGQNFVLDSTSTPATSTPVATAKNQYYYDADNKVCHISQEVSSGVWGWDATAFVPAKVTLSWKQFTIAGSGADSGVQIAGWNVYRREAGTDFDFKGGHLRASATAPSTDPTTAASVRTFTDTTAIAGKVYYYLVRPVDNRRSLPTYTPEIYSEVRITAPTPNYVFVHRWMINQEICNSMNMTTTTTNKVDPTKNFRCPYVGPGATGAYYDYGADLLVDKQEMGCAYSKAPNCSADGCIGLGTPTALGMIGVNGDIFYDRSSGTCHIHDAVGWKEMNTAIAGDITAAISSSLRSSLNAPLVNLVQSQAKLICSNRLNQATLYSGLSGVLTSKLPSKKDYMAYSAHSTTTSDADIGDMEQGFSLNGNSRCNGSAASGLETAYTDSSIPSTSFMYTLPGTAASGIRSLVTGSIPLSSSKSTESCVTRYGAQDVYGNVAEWTTDQMKCVDGTKICEAYEAVAGDSSLNYDFDPGAPTEKYAFKQDFGPFYNTIAGDLFITSWTLADELYDAGKFSLPVGMPLSNNISTTVPYSSSDAIQYLLDIGTTAGISNSKLHDDAFILNGADTANTVTNPTEIGSLVVGGGYNSGTRTGRWTTELVPETAYDNDIGFRCVVPIDNSNYPTPAASKHTYPY